MMLLSHQWGVEKGKTVRGSGNVERECEREKGTDARRQVNERVWVCVGR